MSFLRVNRESPCQICGKPDWCVISKDGKLAMCMRVSEGATRTRELSDGNIGYFHDIDGDRLVVPMRVASKSKNPPKNAGELRKMMERGLIQGYSLPGCSTDALRRLGAITSPDGHLWVPMFDDLRRLIGILVRAQDGKKWAITGSHNGLFIPDNWRHSADPLLVCEGPTDTAAALDLGYDAIGRPSCNGGRAFLVKMCVARDVVIVEDNDKPGQDGAERLAENLLNVCPELDVRIITPKHDLRSLSAQHGPDGHGMLKGMIMHARKWELVS